ncbi:hypothetical protein [Olleya marilimosa]|uniref:Outer membrane protein beta-barrel domain-containing protein n=1 Tax=Olleya marilimosa TaxID=272164 RepID=A0ABR8LXW8_9FLAO|nr:hypothetical protein [Olleya marilimosa]MBD3863107.1 hypothetical protein [Olleya marilimosa]
MKKIQFILLVALTIGFVTKNFGQHTNYKIKNGFSLGGGITQFDIITDNFETKKGDGWIANMTATVDIPQKWFNVSYGMQLSENTISTSGFDTPLSSIAQDVEYKIFTAQVQFLWHAKPFKSSHFTIDFGPMLQYNSDLELSDDKQESFILADFDTVQAKAVKDLNNFNVNGTVGATLGIGFFKLRAQYIYGFTNILGALNDSDFNQVLGRDFKGNQSMFAFTGMLTF